MKPCKVSHPQCDWDDSAQSCSYLTQANIQIEPLDITTSVWLEASEGTFPPLQHSYLCILDHTWRPLVDPNELIKYRLDIIEKYADPTAIRIALECLKRNIPINTDLIQQYTFDVMTIVMHKVRLTGNPHPPSVIGLIEQTIKQFVDRLSTHQRR